MIFRKVKNSEEISFCNVDTPEEALELMFDPMATDYEEIMEKMVPTLYGYHAAMGKKSDGEPGDFWEINGFASADDKVPAEVRGTTIPRHRHEMPNTEFEQIRKNMMDLIMEGTDNYESWVKENPKKTSEILKALTDVILDQITGT